MRARLAELAELCRARSLPLFVVHQPLMTYIGDSRRADWPILPIVEWFRATCAELHVPALHLLGWIRGYADNVDRFAEGAPPDCLTDQYIADEGLQAALTWARAQAANAGKDWDALPYAEQITWFAGYPLEIPKDPDFHLTAAGYAHIGRLAYEALRAQGMLP